MKILRRLTAAMLALVMVVTMLPVGALAEEVVGDGVLDVPETVETETEETVPETAAPEVFVEETAQTFGAGIGGECGEGMTWSLVNGVLAISGIGVVTDRPWEAYKNQITRVVIPSGVIYDHWGFFYQYPELTSAYVGMEFIPDQMFRDCEKLTDVTLAASVVSIGEGAFSECDSLTEIVIPDSVVSIGESAFHMCSSLTSATLPKGLTVIPYNLFASCKKLEKVTIPENVSSIGSRAFYYCNLNTIELPEGLISIGDNAFGSCDKLKNINIPASVESIGRMAFAYCDNLENIDIPASVESIGDLAFWQMNESKLKAIYVSPENAYYSSDDRGVLFNKDKTVLMEAPNLLSGSYTVPSSVKTIKERAFSYCDYLTEIKLPDTLTSIEHYAFSGCRRLVRANIPTALTVLTEESFNDCPLEEIILPDGLVAIEDGVFRQGRIVNDPDVEPTVTELIIPASVKEIGANVFLGIESLEKVTFLGDAPVVNVQYDWENPPFRWIQADFYYYADNETWTEEAKYALTGDDTGYGYDARWHAIGETPTITADIAGSEICTKPLICGSVYTEADGNAMNPVIVLKPTEMFQDVTVNFTLPKGFSFEENALVSETSFHAEWLPGEEEIRLETYIYPIYIDQADQREEYSVTIDITGTDSTGEVRTSTEKEVFYRPSYTRNTAQSLCEFEAADYTFSLNSAMGSGSVYNQETARLCAMMANMAYNRDNMETFLESGLGFSGFERQGIFIDSDPKLGVSGRYYAHKQVIENGEIKNLVYVICRGTPSLPREWISNVITGWGDTHHGFNTAASTINKELAAYCKKYGFTAANTSIVVTGHSRGAAAANLVGHWLNTDAGLAAKENISVYTFATPTVNKNIITEEAGYRGHENIFNYVNYQDVIRNSASMKYYGRYGSTTIFAFEMGQEGATEHFDGYWTYPLPNNGTNYTLNEMFNSILYDCDTSSPLSVGKALFALGNFVKKRVSLFDSGLAELGGAHSMSLYYCAVLKNASGASFDQVNKRTEEVNQFMWKWLEELGDVLKDYIMYSFKCPINLYVYNSDGTLVASIVDKQVTCDDENLLVFMNGDSLNVGCLADDMANYTIKVEGYDNGTMTHCIQTVGIDGIKDIQVRRNIPIVKDGIWEVGSDGYIEDASGYTKYEDPQEIEDILTNLDNPAPSHDFQLGDVNHDTKINAKDATLILQKSVGVLKPTAKFCEECAEVSGDGKLNAKDSTLILQFSVGLRDSFPAGA